MGELSERLYDILDLPAADEAGALLAIEIPQLRSIENLWGRQARRLAVGVTRHIMQTQVRDGDLVAQVRHNMFVIYAKNASIAQGEMVAERIANAALAACADLNDGIGEMMQLEIKGIAHVKRAAFDALVQKSAQDDVPANENFKSLRKYAQLG